MKEKARKNRGLFRNLDLTFLTADIGKERRYLFENIALMLLGGLNIADVLKAIEAELKSSKIKSIVNRMYDQIQNGDPIWKALGDSGLLSEHLLSVVKIGEESGRLAENLQIVVEQKERDAEFRAKLRSASLYPGFVLILMIFIGLGVGIFILPRLSGIYENLSVELPLITQIMISLGNFMGKYGYIFASLVLITISLITYILFINKKTKGLGQSLILKTPILKRLIQEIEISRLGFLFGTLLNAGIPLVEALHLVKESSSFYAYQKMYEGWVVEVEKGYSLKEAFDRTVATAKFLPLYPKQAIITGERTGTLGNSLIKIGEIYIKKNENSTKDLSILLEPILLMIVWTGVAFIAFAVILPIYSLVGDITQVTQEQSQGISEPEAPEQEAVNEFNETVNNTREIITSGDLVIVNQQIVPVFDQPNGNQIDTVEIGESYSYSDVNDEWYEILLPDSSNVWVNSDFIQVL